MAKALLNVSFVSTNLFFCHFSFKKSENGDKNVDFLHEYTCFIEKVAPELILMNVTPKCTNIRLTSSKNCYHGDERIENSTKD